MDALVEKNISENRLRERVALIGKFLLAGLAGLLIGLGVTFAALRNGVGFGAVKAGPWTAWPKAGGDAISTLICAPGSPVQAKSRSAHRRASASSRRTTARGRGLTARAIIR